MKLKLPNVTLVCEWKSVLNLEGVYEVSSTGQVRSLKRNIIMSQSLDKRGYPKVNLQVNGKNKSVLVHRLVATAFIDNPHAKPCVNHKNGIKHDNRVENLEWVTYLENTQHSYTVLLRKGVNYRKYGKLNSNRRAVNQFDIYGNFIRSWDSIIDIENAGVCRSNTNITACCRHRVKTAVGFKWEYV